MLLLGRDKIVASEVLPVLQMDEVNVAARFFLGDSPRKK